MKKESLKTHFEEITLNNGVTKTFVYYESIDTGHFLIHEDDHLLEFENRKRLDEYFKNYDPKNRFET